MIIARTYYQGIPRDLQEAADIDGATEMAYFFKILIPVCTPIIATISMWNFVGMWNSYFDAMRGLPPGPCCFRPACCRRRSLPADL